MKHHPDSPCSCGSKKRYRNCCKPKRDREKMFLFVGVVIGGVFVAKFLFGPDQSARQAPPGKVWSAEHGHYHDAVPAGGQAPVGRTPGAPGSSAAPPGNANAAQTAGAAQPPGPAPPGKVWSAEHGHWHDAAPGNPAGMAGGIPPPSGAATPNPAKAGARNIPQPDGPVPAGKVWSADHGHWHDAPER